MLTLLLGLIVLVFWLGLLPFLVPYIGLLILLIWVILGFPFWNFLFSSSNGLVIDCSVRRLLDHMFGLAVLFRFPLFLFQRELKFDMGANSLAVWLERLGNFLGGLARFLPLSGWFSFIQASSSWLESVLSWADF